MSFKKVTCFSHVTSILVSSVIHSPTKYDPVYRYVSSLTEINSGLHVLRSFPPQKLVAIVKSSSTLSEIQSLQFQSDLVQRLTEGIDDFKVPDLIVIIKWLLCENVEGIALSRLVKLALCKISSSLSTLSPGDFAVIIHFINTLESSLISRNFILQIDHEVSQRIKSSSATPNLIHAILTVIFTNHEISVLAIGLSAFVELLESQWTSCSPALSLFQQCPSTFTGVQIYSIITFITSYKNNKEKQRLNIDKNNLLKACVEGLLYGSTSTTTNIHDNGSDYRPSPACAFDVLPLSQQIEILIQLEGKFNARVLCEKCFEGLQREIDCVKHVDKIVLLKLSHLAKTWKPTVSRLQGPFPALLRAKLYQFSTIEILQILHNVTAIGFHPTALITKFETILKQRVKMTPDFLKLPNEVFLRMMRDVISCGITNKALFGYFVEALSVPQLDEKNNGPIDNDNFQRSRLFHCNSFKVPRLASYSPNDLLSILCLWSSAKMLNDDLFNNISHLVSTFPIDIKVRPSLILRVTVGCATVSYRNTTLFGFLEHQIENINLDRHFQILEILQLREAMDSLGLTAQNVNKRLKEALPNEIRPREQLNWCGTQKYHPSINTHGTVRARKYTW